MESTSHISQASSAFPAQISSLSSMNSFRDPSPTSTPHISVPFRLLTLFLTLLLTLSWTSAVVTSHLIQSSNPEFTKDTTSAIPVISDATRSRSQQPFYAVSTFASAISWLIFSLIIASVPPGKKKIVWFTFVVACAGAFLVTVSACTFVDSSLHYGFSGLSILFVFLWMVLLSLRPPFPTSSLRPLYLWSCVIFGLTGVTIITTGYFTNKSRIFVVGQYIFVSAFASFCLMIGESGKDLKLELALNLPKARDNARSGDWGNDSDQSSVTVFEADRSKWVDL